MNKVAVAALFERLKAANPHPRSELQYDNPFELLVAVALSAQATDVSVNKVTPALFARAPARRTRRRAAAPDARARHTRP